MRELWDVLDRTDNRSAVDRKVIDRIGRIATVCSVRVDIDLLITDGNPMDRNMKLDQDVIRICMAKEPFGTLKHLKDQLHKALPDNNAYVSLLAWIPELEEQVREIETQPSSEKYAQQLDRILDHAEKFEVTTEYLHTDRGLARARPTDSLFALSRNDAEKIVPVSEMIKWALDELSDNFARERCADNMPLIASKLATVGAVLGFNKMIVKKSLHAGRKPKMTIIVHRGTETITDTLYSLNYLTDVNFGKDTFIDHASYDVRTEQLHVHMKKDSLALS